jgi:hypothetical protein
VILPEGDEQQRHPVLPMEIDLECGRCPHLSLPENTTRKTKPTT